jgi:hypothetical protein
MLVGSSNLLPHKATIRFGDGGAIQSIYGYLHQVKRARHARSVVAARSRSAASAFDHMDLQKSTVKKRQISSEEIVFATL